MNAVIGRLGRARPRAAASDNGLAHPAWRKVVAGGMAFVFALTLAVMGLMLCAAPIIAP
jgi:hypothetical protein